MSAPPTPIGSLIPTFVIESTHAATELCAIGHHTGTDKSPYNPTGHRHPYTPVYSILFAPLKRRPIRLAEIGVARGASAVMWNSYFTHPDTLIHMFDRDADLLQAAMRQVRSDRVRYGIMDVSIDGDVSGSLEVCSDGLLYDVIIDDSSHEHGHQLRIIREAFPLLKPGGILVIEDVFRSIDEREYYEPLKDVLEHCSFYYFALCEHALKWSPGWNNDRLLILVKE